MNATAWISAISSLVGAVIGAGAALRAQAAQLRHQARDAGGREHKEAVEELLVCAQALDLRSQQSVLLAGNLGSVYGLLARLLGSLTAVDLQAEFERLNADANALQRAAARIWLFADDEELVGLSNAVVLAATDVVTLHYRPRKHVVWAHLQVAFLGRVSRDEEELAAAREKMAHCRRALVIHVRKRLALAEIDPYSSATAP